MNEKDFATISESGSLSKALREAIEGNETSIEVLRDFEEDGHHKIVVENRILQPEQPKEPEKRCSPRRSHTFHTINSVDAYLKKFGAENTVVLADAKRRVANIVMDELAEDGFEVLLFIPTFHPLFVSWEGILNKAFPVMDFAQFVMERRRDISRVNNAADEDAGRDLALTFSQIKASKQITIQQGQGKKSINGVMVEMEIAGSKKETPVELPDSIHIDVPIFLSDKDKTELELDLLVFEKGGEICVKATSSELESMVSEHFVEDMLSLSIDGVTVGFGTVEHSSWETLPLISND